VVSGSMKRLIILFTISLLAIAQPTYAAKPKALVIPPDINLYIMAGQSNMSGRATYPVPQMSDSLAFTFGDDFTWCAAREPVDRKCSGTRYADTVNWDGTNAIYGPELSFAVNLRTMRPDYAVGLLPCAKGATDMTEWAPIREEGSLWAACVKRAYAAQMYGNVAGLIFWQGESDAISCTLAAEWEDNFTEMVEAYRVEFGNIPVVFAQLNDHADDASHPCWSTLQTEQYSASQNIPNSVMVAMSGLPLQSDGVHHTTAGYTSAGLRLADGLCTLLGDCQ